MTDVRVIVCIGVESRKDSPDESFAVFFADRNFLSVGVYLFLDIKVLEDGCSCQPKLEEKWTRES